MILDKYYLIETIKIINGNILNINYHNFRFNNSRLKLFNIKTKIDLLDIIINYPSNTIIKCRILYNQKINSIQYTKYIEKKINKFYFINNNLISYKYKYANRDIINNLKYIFSKKYEKDYEIIIIKNNFITDTSISNLAFYNNKEWITPKKPLLYGTTIMRLLYNKKIIQQDISIKDIKNFSKIGMLNSMLNFKIFNIKEIYKWGIEVF